MGALINGINDRGDIVAIRVCGERRGELATLTRSPITHHSSCHLGRASPAAARRHRGAGAEVPVAAVTAKSPDAPAQADAERRQLTVMFCDLAGSTALSARLDPEDLREIIAAYHRAVADVVAGFDGFVTKYMGDGVLVYFSYPLAGFLSDELDTVAKGRRARA
jgi:class 3 adenylate cyclase